MEHVGFEYLSFHRINNYNLCQILKMYGILFVSGMYIIVLQNIEYYSFFSFFLFFFFFFF